MQTEIGEKGLSLSWQQKFPKETKCVHCGKTARIGFVTKETKKDGTNTVSALHKNKEDEMWPHDAIAVAVYFCKECLETTSLYNQA